MGPSPLKVHIRFAPKNLCILLGSVSTKFLKKIVKFQNLDFCHFFFVSVNMGPYGRKNSNDILSESAQQICSQTFMHTSRKGLYQSCIKNCEISVLDFFLQFFLFFLGAFNMVVNGEL